MRILITEDDRDILRNILRYFDSFGYVCETAKSFKEAYAKLKESSFDCIILDLNLPDGNGLDLIRKITEEKIELGILILSANNSLEDKLEGLDLGADDYLVKPFHLSELNARVKSIIRRKKFAGNKLLRASEISIDIDAKEVFVNETKLKLTKREYELLLFLITNKNKVVTKLSISEHIWGDYMEQSYTFDFIYSQLKNLRKKIEDAGGNDYIETVYGIGYKFIE